MSQLQYFCCCLQPLLTCIFVATRLLKPVNAAVERKKIFRKTRVTKNVHKKTDFSDNICFIRENKYTNFLFVLTRSQPLLPSLKIIIIIISLVHSYAELRKSVFNPVFKFLFQSVF